MDDMVAAADDAAQARDDRRSSLQSLPAEHLQDPVRRELRGELLKAAAVASVVVAG
jgi:hypothetical protein